MAIKDFRVTNGLSVGSNPVSPMVIQETITSNSAVTVDTIPLNSFLAAEYTVTITQGSKIRTSKVLIQTDGTSVDMTEFGIMETGGLIEGVLVSATTASTNALLQITVTDASSTLVRFKLIKNTTNLISYAPDAPTNVSATATGPGTATIVFTAPEDNGNSTIISYRVTASNGRAEYTSASPLVLNSFASGNYTFTVAAINSQGISAESVTSSSVSIEAPPVVTGGTLYSDSTYYYRTFTTNGTLAVSDNAINVDILTIAGGGGGNGGNGGGGGGAGGVQYGANTNLSIASYAVTIGAGGAAATNGVDSSFGSILIAKGGGRGGGSTTSVNATTGGSGGGAGSSGGNNGTVGASQAGTGGIFYGNAGGLASLTGQSGSGYKGGGGGGGAGVAGGDGSSLTFEGGLGGDGLSTWSAWGLATGTGQNVSGTYYYAGGGTGGSGPVGNARGGYGGGGNGPTGTSSPRSGTAGTANTGGGAGGSHSAGAYFGTNAPGGSGIVIVRYLKSQVAL